MGKSPGFCFFSFYIAVCLNIAFYKQVLQDLPLNSLRNVLVFISMPVVAFSVVNSVLTLASFIWLNRLLACVFILVGAAAQYFILTYGIIIDRSMIANMMDTTPAETFALMTPQMVLTLGLSGVLAAVIAFWVKIRPATPRLRSGLYRLASVLISILLIILVAAFLYKDYASLFRNNKQLIKALSPSNSIVASWSWYSHQRLANLPLVRIGEDAHRNPLMLKGDRKNLTILIVGETSRGDDFSLGGYPRDTNPRLAKTMWSTSRIPPLAARRPRSPFPACFLICRANIMTKSWRITRKGYWILSSAQGLTYCGMIMTAAVKAHAIAFRIKMSPS